MLAIIKFVPYIYMYTNWQFIYHMFRKSQISFFLLPFHKFLSHKNHLRAMEMSHKNILGQETTLDLVTLIKTCML